MFSDMSIRIRPSNRITHLPAARPEKADPSRRKEEDEEEENKLRDQ